MANGAYPSSAIASLNAELEAETLSIRGAHKILRERGLLPMFRAKLNQMMQILQMLIPYIVQGG